MDVAVRSLIAACLTPARVRIARLVNHTEEAEDLHQLRVDLRRLRSVLRLSQDWGIWTAPPSVLPALAELFSRLGPARDREVLVTQWLPALHAAGAPRFELPDLALACQPAEVLRSPAVSQLFDELATLPAEGHWQASVCAGLEVEWRWLRRRARDADRLDDAALHAVRKRAKRLRYGVEAAADLFGRRKVQHFLRDLAALQDVLGRFNDLRSARTLFTDLAQTEPRAWFAVGWFSARQDAARRDSRRALVRFRRVRCCW